MPDCAAQHVVGYLFEIGPVAAGGAVVSPVSHAEIAAWSGNTGTPLNAWESRAIRALSIEYIEAVHAAKPATAQMPWVDAPYSLPQSVLAAERMKQHMREIADM